MEKTLKFGKNQLILTNERYKLNFDNISRLGEPSQEINITIYKNTGEVLNVVSPLHVRVLK